jgi:hypothetical protein
MSGDLIPPDKAARASTYLDFISKVLPHPVNKILDPDGTSCDFFEEKNLFSGQVRTANESFNSGVK